MMRFKIAREVYDIGGIKAALKTWWSMRLAIMWGAVSAMLFVWPSFMEVLPQRWWAGLGFVMAFSIIIARVLHQPGSDEL